MFKKFSALMKFVTDVSAEMIWLGSATLTVPEPVLFFCVCAWSLSRFWLLCRLFFFSFFWCISLHKRPCEAIAAFSPLVLGCKNVKLCIFSVARVLSSRLWRARPVNKEWGFVGNERQMSICCLTETPVHEPEKILMFCTVHCRNLRLAVFYTCR